MRVTRMAVVLSLCAIVLFAETLRADSALPQMAPPDTLSVSGSRDLKQLKVHLCTRTLWSDGEYTHAEMAAAARAAGYDAIFFADDALLFGAAGKLADPSFEDVDQVGHLNRWETGTLGPKNSLAEAGAFALPSSPTNVSYYYAKERIKSGNHSLHLAVASSSTQYRTDGIAFARDVFPSGYIFRESTVRPSNPLLLSDLTFSVNAFIDALGYADVPMRRRGPANFSDNAWFYLQFDFTTQARYGPRSGQRLIVRLIYTDHESDSWLRRIRGQMNETNSKVIYLGIPPLRKWLSINVNVTDLAFRLWNQTIVEEWRLRNFEIGTRSRGFNALASVYVDDVSIRASVPPSWTPLDYVQTVENRLSTSSFGVYSGYSIDPPDPYQLSMRVYGTTFLDLSREYNLTDTKLWHAFGSEISSRHGMLVLGPINSIPLTDYIVASGTFGVNITDATTWAGMIAAVRSIKNGIPVVLAATRRALRPQDYNSSETWSTMVFAKSNSEADILEAIAQGRAYIATGSFDGTFSVNAYGLRVLQNPIYTPSGENASFTVSFAGLAPGKLRVYDSGTLRVGADHTGNATALISLPMTRPVSSFLVAVTGQNDSLSIVKDPFTFVQTSMIPNGALLMDNDEWSLESSRWTSSYPQQRLELVVSGPVRTSTLLYLYSPVFRPDARQENQVARSIRVGDMVIDLRRIYDTPASAFVLPLQSTGEPIQIVFNFDVTFTWYVYYLLSSVALLYGIVAMPFLIVLIYMAIRRLRRRGIGARESYAPVSITGHWLSAT